MESEAAKASRVASWSAVRESVTRAGEPAARLQRLQARERLYRDLTNDERRLALLAPLLEHFRQQRDEARFDRAIRALTERERAYADVRALC